MKAAHQIPNTITVPGIPTLMVRLLNADEADEAQEAWAVAIRRAETAGLSCVHSPRVKTRGRLNTGPGMWVPFVDYEFVVSDAEDPRGS